MQDFPRVAGSQGIPPYDASRYIEGKVPGGVRVMSSLVCLAATEH
jgi:hypothetical protein